MEANPAVKPKLATRALIMSSAAVFVCVCLFAGILVANWPSELFFVLPVFASILAAATVCAVWFARARRQRAWTASANEKWSNFDDAKRAHLTTAEITVLSVDALEPTGSWITIKWNRFDHVQRAWIEAMHDPIWPGSILLVAPDPAQVRPGAPWPATYYIRAADCLAWAPCRVDRSTPKPHG